MPQRTNEFQRLIRFIHEQLVPAGARVRESVMLKNPRTKTEREIDVLIEYEIIDTTTRIAVESRDRSRCADVEWIDGLIGKYRDLPVNQIIAVSSKGFTRGAESHAKSGDPRIELRTLRQAMDTDWPAELIRVGMSGVAINLQVLRVEIISDPPWDEPGLPTAAIRNGVQNPFADFARECGQFTRENLKKSFMDQVKQHAKTKRDVMRARWEQEVTITTNDTTMLLSASGQRRALRSMNWRVALTATLVDVPVQRRLYGPAAVGVTTGTIQGADGTKLRVTAVQAPGKDVAPLLERVGSPPPRKRAPKSRAKRVLDDKSVSTTDRKRARRR